MRKKSRQTSDGELAPLTPTMYAILLSLAGGKRHGLGILDDVERRTEGDTVLPIGTLYRSITRLCDTGLIEPARPSRRADATTDPRRNYYVITNDGRLALSRETTRLDRLMRWARGLRPLIRPT